MRLGTSSLDVAAALLLAIISLTLTLRLAWLRKAQPAGQSYAWGIALSCLMALMVGYPLGFSTDILGLMALYAALMSYQMFKRWFMPAVRRHELVTAAVNLLIALLTGTVVLRLWELALRGSKDNFPAVLHTTNVVALGFDAITIVGLLGILVYTYVTRNRPQIHDITTVGMTEQQRG